MDNFILENDTWLRYLPIIIYALIVAIVVMLIIIGFLFYKRYKNKRLKSQKHKSVFAASYEKYFVSNASSSAPLKRNTVPEQDMHFTHIIPAVRIPNRPQSVSHVQAQTVFNQAVSDRHEFLNNSRIIDFYFEFEDEYKI